MRFLLVLLFFIELLLSKILIVNSYSVNDQCGIPQLQGFLAVMYKNGYKPTDFDIYFLNSRKSSKKKMLKKVSNILKNLNKYKFVVVFDDMAFKLVGIPASKNGKWVYFSGMNYPYRLYEKKYKLPLNISGVYEKLYIKNTFKVFNKIKPINKIALFYSDGIGEVLKLQVQEEVKNTIFSKKIDYIKVNTLKELIKKTKMVNSNNSYTLFLPFALSLKNKNQKIPFSKFKNVYLKNIKKPDNSVNMAFAKLGFLGFGGVDFYKMGMQLAKLIINHPYKHIIEDAKDNYFFINVKRAKEINFTLPEWFLKKYVKVLLND